SNHLLNLHFHKKEFFRRVYIQTELLGRSENISDDEMLLAQAAAILLFSGLSETYENFENRSAEIAKNILPEFGFDERQTERVFNLIPGNIEMIKIPFHSHKENLVVFVYMLVDLQYISAIA
ncbi:MAG: hypothetical protein WD317_01495, partial [Balneolaceae bacterium]